MNDTEIYQNSSKKRPPKNYRGGSGDYSCFPGCQSAFYNANRVKTGIHVLNCQKIQHCVGNGCKLLYRRTGGADKFTETATQRCS